MKTEEIATNFKEIWALFKETDARLDKRFKETDARLDKRFQETDREITRLEKLYTSQWGKLIESLSEIGLEESLKKRGIKIDQTATRFKSHKNGRTMELDFLLKNKEELVIGEVKTTLKVQDVIDFLEDLREFFTFFPDYRGRKIYGAIIGIKIEEKADRFAYKNGLFVFKVGGEGMLRMLNDAKFKPRDFGEIVSDR